MSIIQKYLNMRSAFAVYIAVVLSLAYCNTGFTEVNNGSPWPLEITPKYKPVYGDIVGVSSKDGDYIGLFDKDGNCHGAGLVRGGRYFASAYWQTEARELFSDDYTDKGFENGDEVFFRFHQQSNGEVFDLMPNDGNKFYYMYEESERDKPARVDLAYKRDFHVEVQPPAPDDEGGYDGAQEGVASGDGDAASGEGPVPEIVNETASGSSGVSTAGFSTGSINLYNGKDDTAEDTGEATEAEEKLKEIEETILAETGELVAKADQETGIPTRGSHEEYESIDYRDRRSTGIEVDRQTPSSQAATKAQGSSDDERLKTASHLTHKGDQAKKMVVAKALSPEQADAEKLPASGPDEPLLPVLLMSAGFILIIIAILLVVFKRRKDEDVEKDKNI